MNSRITDADVVLRLVKKSPGLPGSWYAWVRGGGQIRDGQPEGMIEVDFRVMQKMLKVQQRLHELERRERVRRSGPVVRAKTGGLGYYVVGDPVVHGAGSRRDVAVEPKVKPPQVGGSGRAVLQGIKGLLK
ncbi:MAG: hypothetical protein GY788_07340 [bacterium]|nr:hypothetical protein [bacterium]